MTEPACPQCGALDVASHRYCPQCGFPLAEVSDKTGGDPLIGKTLPGGYVVLELVGVGGMGRVYRAEQKALGRTVAVKVVHPHLLGDESASVRFITEARAASRLNHPNSVGVIDFGKSDGRPYLVMEFLRGHDLARVLYDDGPLPILRAIDIVTQVLAALGEAHALDIIHRDLKPENIVIETKRSGGDFVKVVDFGLAKMHETTAGTGVTSPGIVCGTPDYMAPEQGRGDVIDARTDLYACGVILFQILTGKLPFEADSPTQVVLMHITVTAPDLAKIAPNRKFPDSLVALVRKALSKNREDRYPTADAFAEALDEIRIELEGGRSSLPDAGIRCPSCEAFVPSGQKFCGECGSRISTPPVKVPSIAPPRVERVQSLPSLPLPLVSREDDLDWLEAHRDTTHGALTPLAVVGDAGVGKTRLLQEWAERARAAGDMVVWLGPDPWWAGVGYYTLKRAITALAGLPADGGDASAWRGTTPEARRGLMEIFGRSERRSEPLGQHWLREDTEPLTPDNRRLMAADALRWAIAQPRQDGPARRTVLIIDDFHAVDGASQNAIMDLVAEPPLASLVLVVAQPQSPTRSWPGASLQLSGLATSIAAGLVKGVDRSPESERSGKLAPLYVDQLVRLAMDGGGEPPARLADLIALRIEHLPPEARRLLQAIAVVGNESTETEVARVLSLDEGSVFEALGMLGASGFVVRDSSMLFGVSHPLMRDVALATIPASVRRELHTRALIDMDGLPIEVRALHAYYAQDAFEALMLLEQAGELAAQRGDTEGNLFALHRALDLARREVFRGELDDPLRAVLIFARKLGDALAATGALTDAEGLLREALDLAGPSGRERARVLGSLAHVAQGRARPSEARAYLHEAISVARDANDEGLVDQLGRLEHSWVAAT